MLGFTQRKMPDPACEAQEAECKGKKRDEAEKMAEKEKKQESTHADLKKVAGKMLKAVEGIPEKCKTMRF